MNTHDFYFDLPKDQIAQRPTQPRDHSRLLHLDKSTGAVSHHHFYDLPSLLKPGDALIINDSRVLPARLYGVSADTGAPIEFLLLQEKEKDVWEILCKPGKRAKEGKEFSFQNLLSAKVLQIQDDGNRIVQFSYRGDFYSLLVKFRCHLISPKLWRIGNDIKPFIPKNWALQPLRQPVCILPNNY